MITINFLHILEITLKGKIKIFVYFSHNINFNVNGNLLRYEMI